MKKLCTALLFCFTLQLTSCGGVDSQIEDYEDALKSQDIEEASKILSDIKAADMTDSQKEKIQEIHDEYFSDAVDAYIDRYEQEMKDGNIEEAAKMLIGVDERALTSRQMERIVRISLEFADDAASSFGDITNSAMDELQDINDRMDSMFDE